MSTLVPSATSPTVASRNRMIVYGVAIVVIFAAMYPYTEWLNRVKARKELGEATIGQIDTGSFMLKLALLGGFRGVAANVFWTRAIEYQKMHEWDRLDATIEMITKLQPHFLSVWTYQGWNLAYNVSVEWDDPADKYDWIKKGIKFVQRGVANNQKSPDLLWDTAWTYYHKIGFADEAVILRKLFHDDTDEDFKLDPVIWDQQRIRVIRDDNFQVGYGWFTRAVKLVDDGLQRITSGARQEENLNPDLDYVDAPVQHKGRPGDMGFRSMPAHAQTRYATALEKASIKGVEPKFGRFARNEWDKALQEWIKFGTYPFDAFSHPDQKVQLDWISWVNDKPDQWAKLTDPQRYWTERWSNDTNYRYWKDRCATEGTAEGVEARRFFYEATLAYKRADFKQARDKYLEGLKIWEVLLKDHDDYRNDLLNQKDIAFVTRRYALSLRQTGVSEPPTDMPFYDVWKLHGNEQMPPDPYDSLEMLGRPTQTTTQ